MLLLTISQGRRASQPEGTADARSSAARAWPHAPAGVTGLHHLDAGGGASPSNSPEAGVRVSGSNEQTAGASGEMWLGRHSDIAGHHAAR